MSLQRILGLGSYSTAWTWLHKLRRAMVRPGRDRLQGTVEVDETYWGAQEKGVVGRLTEDKALIIVAAEKNGRGIGRIRLRRISDVTKASLHGFIAEAVEPGSTVQTDGLNAYLGLEGYIHDRHVLCHQSEGEHLLPRVHQVISLLKRWLLGTHRRAATTIRSDSGADRTTWDSHGGVSIRLRSPVGQQSGSWQERRGMHGLRAENHAKTTLRGGVERQDRPRDSSLDEESARRLEDGAADC